MIKLAAKIILNRNFILVLALVLGVFFGKPAIFIKDYTFYILSIVMTFSTTGIAIRAMFPLRKMIKPMLAGIFLNYVVFGAVIIRAAWLILPSEELFIGIVVIAATPPGVAIIPFSHILKGNLEYSIVGVLGAFLSSVILAPAIIGYFAYREGEGINSLQILITMGELVLLPLIISRFLLWEPIKPITLKIRGKIVDWGFAIIIFTAVGINREVFFSNFEILLQVSLVTFIATFGLGSLYELITKKMAIPQDIGLTQNLLLTIKSSGFSVVTAITLFGTETAIPAAVMAVFVLGYLLYLSFRMEYKS